MKVKTSAGTITVTDAAVLITRRKWLGGGGEERCVRLSDITGVDFQLATTISPGHIRILHTGNSSSFKLRDYDRDTILFRLEEQPQILPVRAHLMRRIAGDEWIEPASPSVSPASVAIQLIGALVGMAVLGWWVFS